MRKPRGTAGRIAPLQELARQYAVDIAYEDVHGHRREASPEALLAVLPALGAAVSRMADASAALRERVQRRWRRCLDPIVVAWDGVLSDLVLRLPAADANSAVEYCLQLDGGAERRRAFRLEELEDAEMARVEGIRYVVKRIQVAEWLPHGYHRLVVEFRAGRFEALVLAAPTRAYSPEGPGWQRSWGLFVPPYALHSEQSWGAGDFADLRMLVEWLDGLGGGVVSTLPLLPTWLDEPYDPSPYSPVSRLFWNEFYLNIPQVPELTGCAAAQEGLGAPEIANAVRDLRAQPLVDYRRQMALNPNRRITGT